MSAVTVKIAFTEGADPELGLPAPATDGAAGLDLKANLQEDIRPVGITLEPGTRQMIPCGIRIALPRGFEAQVRPRSGLACRHGVSILNGPGTIDSDYRGEINVILINHGEQPFHVRHGDRIAQMIVAPVTSPRWEVTELGEETERGREGFGSTGTT